MRLITNKKIYRAFPELDRLSDEKCEKLIKSVKLRMNGYRILAPACLLSFLGGVLLATYITEMISRDVVHIFALSHLTIAFLIMMNIGLPMLAALITRDLVYAWLLPKGMHQFIDKASCPACSYSLIGLVAVDNVVTCPECGHLFSLQERGMTQADLTPDA